MKDIDMIKLCAEALECTLAGGESGLSVAIEYGDTGQSSQSTMEGWFDPLFDDAQAFHLVEKLGLELSKRTDGWHVGKVYVGEKVQSTISVYDVHLNRAIVECVAKLQGAKRNDRS